MEDVSTCENGLEPNSLASEPKRKERVVALRKGDSKHEGNMGVHGRYE
jgi:hypothetical protein